jgi:hypothetical protein
VKGKKKSGHTLRQSLDVPKGGWEIILADAEIVLRDLQSQTRRVKRSIRMIRAKIAAGESIPDFLRQE